MFFLYHHYRLDRLAELQSVLLNRAQRRSVLTPDTVLVPNQGVARWLQIQLAEAQGIAANLDMPLPAKFIWHQIPQLLPSGADSREFERHRLRWHLYALLPHLAGQIPQIARYLDGQPRDVLRLQLADQLAAVFDQYLVFRPRMLFAWQAGQTDGSAEEAWQAHVWRALIERLGPQHRGQLLHAAIQHCQQAPEGSLSAQLPDQLYCFGLGALPPDYLRFFYAIGQHCDVHFLLLNPCAHYWGDIQRQRHSLQPGTEETAEELQLADSHPLLASFGRGTRDLLRVMYSDELQQVQEPQLGEAMAYEPPPPHHLLAKVQAGIIAMQAEPAHHQHGDASIQVHACHGPLREVQVLHDQLLDLLSQDDSLQPRDIVVMMPDVGRYAAAIAGVFGAARGAQHIAWSLSDGSRAGGHPIIGSFMQMLQLPLSRWTAHEVLQLAQVPAVMRRFELDEASLAQLTHWLHAAGVRWGLDASTRRQFEAGEHAQFSWRFGLDRLLLGLSLNDEQALFNGISPWTDLEGGGTAALGQIALLLRRLANWQDVLAQPASARQWQERFHRMLDEMLDSSAADDAELAALQDLQHCLDSLSLAAECLGEETLSWQSVRETLLNELSQASARQPFLSNGVSFCAMQPLRAVPFRVVCLLGMDDGAFPRQERHGSFNLLRQSPRLGDISVRDDDRLLFLQAIMAAQDVFYLSYTGQDVATGDTLAAAPIVGEWLDFLQTYYFSGWDDQTFENKLICRQPMHPFSPSLFGANPPHARVFSFKQAWLPGKDEWDAATAHRFVDHGQRPTPQEPVIELSSLQRFFEHPPRFFLREGLNMQRELPETLTEDGEPLDLDGLQAWQLRDRLLHDARQMELPTDAPDQLLASALLPPSPLGQAEYAAQRQLLTPLLAVQRQWQQDCPQPAWLDVDLSLGQHRLRGRLSGLWSDGPRVLRPGRLSSKYRMRAWLSYLCYLQSGGAGVLQLAGLDAKKASLQQLGARLNPQQARECLQQLIEVFLQGQQHPLPLMPELLDIWLPAYAKHGDEQAALETLNLKLADSFHPHHLLQDVWFTPLLDAQGAVSPDFNTLALNSYWPMWQAMRDVELPA